jgi:dihydroceramidase
MLTLVARTSWLIKHRLPEREREKVTSLYSRGALLFLFGFACWQVDENFCGSLQAVRSYLGPTLGAATELHAWWHLFTGLGSYQMVSAATLLVLSVKSPSERFELVPSFGGLLPYVRRVDSSRKKR